MLQIRNLRKGYGEKLLFEDVSFTLTKGERLGLLGRNGSGKTTLFRLITEEEPSEGGSIEKPRNYRIGYLSQYIRLERGTVLEEASREVVVAEGEWVEEHRAEATLMGLGFSVSDFARPPRELSGGFQVRLQLAKVLLSNPDLLLLDEPTNYLDIVSIRWLERILRNWPKELIIITHDRSFMDSVSTHTMLIHRRKVRRIPGSTEKLHELLVKEEEVHEKTRLNEEKYRRQAERFIDRFRAKASKASVVQSRIKMLEKRGRIEKLQDAATLDFQFNPAPFTGSFMIESEQLSFDYGHGDPPLIDDCSFTIEPGDRVAIIGKNGKGKSTLLNLLGGELAPLKGQVRRHQNLKLAHFGQNNIDRLEPGMTVEEEILSLHPDHDRRAARSICGVMLFGGDDALKKVEVLSGGERARVLLGKLLVSPANLLLLDEPTNHLDMESIDSLIEAVAAFPGGVLIVTHNERVLRAVAGRLVVFDRGQIKVFEGGYQDFLDRVGWGDEEEIAPPRDKNDVINKKELRRRRAEIRNARARTLKPLEREIGRLEAQIVDLEKTLAGLNQALCDASARGNAEEISRLSRELHAARAKIDHHFERLEEVSTECDLRAKRFDELEQESTNRDS